MCVCVCVQGLAARGGDCGYGSEAEGCDDCSTPSSNDGSEVCSDGVCLHEGKEEELDVVYSNTSLMSPTSLSENVLT